MKNKAYSKLENNTPDVREILHVETHLSRDLNKVKGQAWSHPKGDVPGRGMTQNKGSRARAPVHAF